MQSQCTDEAKTAIVRALQNSQKLRQLITRKETELRDPTYSLRLFFHLNGQKIQRIVGVGLHDVSHHFLQQRAQQRHIERRASPRRG